MNRVILLLVLFTYAWSADPFLTPEVVKAAEALKAAEDAYRDAVIAAWAQGGLQVPPIVPLPKDFKDSERKAFECSKYLGNDIRDMDRLVKEWVKPLKPMENDRTPLIKGRVKNMTWRLGEAKALGIEVP